MYKTTPTEEFLGKYVSKKYEKCRKLAINLATMFGSTYEYVCKSSISKMNHFTNIVRDVTNTHVEDPLRICCATPCEPNYKRLAPIGVISLINFICYVFVIT